MKRTNDQPVLDAERLYLGDNGRAFCGSPRCAGSSALYTGRDLSGQRVYKVRAEDVTAHESECKRSYGRVVPLSCEGCRREVSRIAGPDGGAVMKGRQT